MFTYTQLQKRAGTMTGVNIDQSSTALTNIQQDINQGIRNFKNAARRYWTRKEVVTDLVEDQQYYTFPVDMVRITTVRVTSGGLTLPVTIIDSEEMWNRINLIPAMTVGIPTTGFIRGRNELGLYPIPSEDSTNGLIVSYEPRQTDMSIEDTTPAIIVTENSATVTANTSVFNQNMIGQYLTVTDGSDGNWYPIVGYTSPTQITLENVYLGPSKTDVASLIGQAPDVPEDYHLAFAYFAAFNYYLGRKDAATTAEYKALYQDLLNQFKQVYAAKTTGMTQADLNSYAYNMFNLPPQNVTA